MSLQLWGVLKGTISYTGSRNEVKKEDGGQEGGSRREGDRLSCSPCEHGKRFSHFSNTYLSNSPARGEAVVQEAQNSVKMRVHLGLWNEGKCARESVVTVGIILSAITTDDLDACVNLENASILGLIATWLGILASALASLEEHVGG